MSFLVPLIGSAVASYGVEQAGKALGIGGLPPRMPGKQRAVAKKHRHPRRKVGGCGKKKKSPCKASHRRGRRKR